MADPLASRLRSLADQAGAEAASLVRALLSVVEVFGTDLRESAAEQAIVCALVSLRTRGSRGAAASCADADDPGHDPRHAPVSV